MNKYFTFTAILSLFTCVAYAHNLPLVEIKLDQKDVENLFALEKQKTIEEKIAGLAQLYPELEFGILPSDSREVSRYVPRHEETTNGRPKIFLKEPATPDALPRELLHYLIDRARGTKYPEQMQKQKQSFARMLRGESALINHRLMDAILRADIVAKKEWQAKLTLNVLERHLIHDGENIEAIVFLIKNHAALGLTEQDLLRQYQELQRNLDQMTDKATDLMEGATHGLRQGETGAMEDILKWQPLADRLLNVFERLEEIDAYLLTLGKISRSPCEVIVLH